MPQKQYIDIGDEQELAVSLSDSSLSNEQDKMSEGAGLRMIKNLGGERDSFDHLNGSFTKLPIIDSEMKIDSDSPKRK